MPVHIGYIRSKRFMDNGILRCIGLGELIVAGSLGLQNEACP